MRSVEALTSLAGAHTILDRRRAALVSANVRCVARVAVAEVGNHCHRHPHRDCRPSV